jgi:hypothetical protein
MGPGAGQREHAAFPAELAAQLLHDRSKKTQADPLCPAALGPLQKSECASCGFPHARLRKYHWAKKALRRRTTGTGRMRYMRDLPRRAKNGFREQSVPKAKSA